MFFPILSLNMLYISEIFYNYYNKYSENNETFMIIYYIISTTSGIKEKERKPELLWEKRELRSLICYSKATEFKKGDDELTQAADISVRQFHISNKIMMLDIDILWKQQGKKE